MINVRPDILARVRAILAEHVPNVEVRAFGSRVSGTTKPYSDLDLALVGATKIDLATLGNVRQAFSDSDLPIRIDIVDWHDLSDEFREVIEEKFEILL